MEKIRVPPSPPGVDRGGGLHVDTKWGLILLLSAMAMSPYSGGYSL